MITEYYQNFIEIVEQGTLSAAAEKCHVAQPALSNQLKLLEKEYGAQLLIRGARHSQLTEAGKVVYEKARQICRFEEQARQEVIDLENGMSGTLSVALPPTNNELFLARTLQPFFQKNNQISLNLYECTSKEVAEYVQNEIAEIGFIRAPLKNREEFVFYPVEEEYLTLIYNKTHPLTSERKRAGGQNSTFAEALSGANIDTVDVGTSIKCLDHQEIVISRSWSVTIESLSLQYGITPIIRAMTSSRTVAVEWAHLQNIVALVPTGEGDQLPKGMLAERLAEHSTAVQRGFIIKKGKALSKIAEKFIEETIRRN